MSHELGNFDATFKLAIYYQYGKGNVEHSTEKSR